MKKLHSLIACAFVACLTLVLFSSCEKEESGLAPKSVVGKTFNGEYYFETSSTFSHLKDWGDGFMTLIPKKYSYRKTSADTGELTIEYTIRFESTGWEDGGHLMIYLLNFTTTETGWYVDDEGKHNFTLR